MIKYGFFNSVNNDRLYNADDLSNFFAGMLTDGIFKAFENELEVVANNNMSVTVKSGKAMLNYKYMHNDSNLILNVDAHSSFNRTDYVVAYSNLNTRECGIKIVKGLQNETNPELVNSNTYHVVRLASISVTTSTTSITSSDITDLRSTQWIQLTNISTTLTQLVYRTYINSLYYDSNRSQYYLSFSYPIPVLGRDIVKVYANGTLMVAGTDYDISIVGASAFNIYFKNSDLVYAMQHLSTQNTQTIIVEFILNQST